MIRALLIATAGLVLAEVGAAPWAGARAQQAQGERPDAQRPRPGGTELSPSQRRRPQEQQSDPLRAFDLDEDGALNLAEVKSAAAKRYDDFNPSLDDAMTPAEAGPVLSAATFRDADTDRGGTVNKAEYLAFVERRFADADANRNGAINRTELEASEGQALVRFLR